MKRLSIFVLIGLIAISLIACSTSQSNETTTTVEKQTADEQTEATEASKTTEAASTTKAEATTAAETASSETTEAASSETTEASEDLSIFTVPGYEIGEIPPIPLVEIPTIPSYNEEQQALLKAIEEKFESVPGISVKPASCDGNGLVYTSDFIVSTDDASVINSDAGSGVVDSSGAGVLNSDNLTAVITGDGGGVIDKDGVMASIMPDGSGVIEDENKGISLTRMPDGTGTYSRGDIALTITSERSGTFTSNQYSMVYVDENNAQFSSDDLMIIIANGQAMITAGEQTKTVAAKPLAKVPLIGKLPPLEKLERPNVCGLRIVFEDAILFDFDKHELRPAGKEAIEKVAEAIDQFSISALEIHGHTDSKSDEAYNLTLSEKRANSVQNYMQQLGVTASLKAIGFGESKPVAPNENADGSDNPSGRQANRRVEIFIPSN